MKKTIFAATLAVLVLTPVAQAAGPFMRFFQDAKFPQQAMLEHYSWASPVLGGTTSVLAASALANAAATTISSFTAQPDVPRNITLSTGGSTGSVGAGTAVVTGLDIHGGVITEQFTITSAMNGTVTGSQAFKSISSVVFPATSGPSAQLSIGVGTKLGMPRCADRAGDYVFSEFDSAFETSRGTMSVDATTVSKNTFVPNGTMNGSKRVDLFYVQNFRCY